MKPKTIDWRRYNEPCSHTDGTILVCSICLMRRADKAQLQDDQELAVYQDMKKGRKPVLALKTHTKSTGSHTVFHNARAGQSGRPSVSAWSKVVKQRQAQSRYRDRQKAQA